MAFVTVLISRNQEERNYVGKGQTSQSISDKGVYHDVRHMEKIARSESESEIRGDGPWGAKVEVLPTKTTFVLVCLGEREFF